jgi:transcriptional repressor NrdR
MDRETGTGTGTYENYTLRGIGTQVQCPYCGGDSNVVDSRAVGEGVRRRRTCGQCRRRFTTYERVAPPNIKVIKRSGRVEPFDATNLRRVLARVCRDRPGIGEADVRRIAAAIEAELVDDRVKSIPSSALAERLLARLADIDRLAYDRLAANYVDENGLLRVDRAPRDAADDGQLGLFISGADADEEEEED